MKRITKLEISNFRAFFDSYEIELNKGENLLVYGENGSGKSSLFKSLSNFLSSSQDVSFPYIKHHNKDAEPGLLAVTFGDYDRTTNSITSTYGAVVNFGSEVVTTNYEQFIKTAELTKGFLDYKILLSVYNHNKAQPNLFELIVENLLKDFIPSHLGGTHPLGKRFQFLRDQIKNAYHRRTYNYTNGIVEMAAYEAMLREVLNEIFLQLNAFLLRYFRLNLRVWYSLTPLVATGWWRDIPTELKLDIKLNGVLIRHQSDYLNEARLSALAVCLFLAIVKKNPQPIDFKILFLDDVFIGLDSGNRIPIAKILNNEFHDYQIFITTYDRNWFEVAQRFFNSHAPKKWSWAELYSAKHTIDSTQIEIPVLLPHEENYDRAIFYLHHKTKPDYPAAANFFRKAAEEILKKNLPSQEIRDENYALIETYKLGALVNSALHFFVKIGQNASLLLELQNALPSLLHPLSHYELTSQVYKVELEEVQKLLLKLDKQLKDLKGTYRVFIPPGRMFKLNFTISATHTGHYEIYSKECIYILRDSGGALTLSAGNCHCKTCYIMNGTTKIPGRDFNSNDPVAQYSSVQDGYDKIYAHIHAIPAYAHIPIAINYLTEFSYQNENGNHLLEDHKAFLVW